MAVTIRLRRIGRKKQPSYRVVVTDARRAVVSTSTRSFYNPRRQPGSCAST